MSTTATNTRSIPSPQGLARIDATQAKAIFSQGEEAVVFALLELAKQLSEARFPSVNPATPSGMIPIYFNFHLKMKITPGGLIQMWYRLKEWLFEWYQQIHTEANKEQTAKPY